MKKIDILQDIAKGSELKFLYIEFCSYGNNVEERPAFCSLGWENGLKLKMGLKMYTGKLFYTKDKLHYILASLKNLYSVKNVTSLPKFFGNSLKEVENYYIV